MPRSTIPELLLAAVLAACSSRAASGPPRVPVSVARVEQVDVPYLLPATGTVEPMRTVDITSQVGGMLQRVRFAEGDEVQAGQLLFAIDPRPYQAAVQQAEAALARDQAQAQNAARDAERYRILAQDKSVTEADYQQKQASADALRATVQADSAALTVARLNLEYAAIRAPIAGRTGGLQVHEGNLVRANATAPLVTINQLRPILVRFAVPAVQLPELQRRARGRLRVEARTSRDTVATSTGVLSFIDNHVDSTTGTVMLKAKFDNAHGTLWPGEFVDVTLILGIQRGATVIPAQAVVTAQRGTYVFVVTSDGTARQQPVTVQRTIDTLAVIADGLKPGAMVVTDGQLRLTPEARLDIRTGPASEDSSRAAP